MSGRAALRAGLGLLAAVLVWLAADGTAFREPGSAGTGGRPG
ncbi:hypothetical protein AB0D80_21660 [Streptomyces tendae]